MNSFHIAECVSWSRRIWNEQIQVKSLLQMFQY
jgi:hypothetical protein